MSKQNEGSPKPGANQGYKGNESSNDLSTPKKVVVIGGGWAGFTAADSLSKCRANNAIGNDDFENAGEEKCIQIELLDASPRGPGGLAAGWRTAKLNRPVEAGLHGFWREYKVSGQIMFLAESVESRTQFSTGVILTFLYYYLMPEICERILSKL